MTWRRSLALALAAALAVGACGGDDESSDDAPEETTDTTAAPDTAAPSDEEPPGTDPDAVEPYVQDLLTRYDEITSQIVADPAIAAYPDHELYTQLRELMDPNSEMTDAIVQALVRQGEQGIALEAFDGAELPATRTVDGDLETVSEQEIRFPLCTRYDYRLVTSTRIEAGDGHDRRSSGTAALVDGHWLISRLEGNDDIVPCEEAA